MKIIETLKKVSMAAFTRKYGIKFCSKHTGKMRHMLSLSTSCLCNRFCKQRMKNKKLICSHCYSAAMHHIYTALTAVLKKNTEVLTSIIIPIAEMPYIRNRDIVRLEAFGDINNETQVINYFNLCERNTHITFALWTKNPWIIEKALKNGYAKPKNLIIIYSNPYIDGITPEWIFKRFSFIDKIFNVFEEDNGNINCGARSCFTCRRCYSFDTEKIINELLK